MTLHKLTAGDGYQYLTRQTAAADQSLEAGTSLGDYYSEKGERPGQWFGSGLAGLAVGDVSTNAAVGYGSVVTSEQMAALFGVGRHPNADTIEAAIMAEEVALGRTPKQAAKAADAASRLGRVFDSPGDPSEFVLECARAYEAHNVENGHPRSAAIDSEIRAQIRTKVGRDLFKKRYERDPADKRELSGFIARESRPRQQACAGYDLTFSPVKSVSTLWAVADLETSKIVQDAHEAAVNDAIAWLESEVIYTRRGAQGARIVDIEGVLAAGFIHRDNRNGDPDLHTHVAIANKVRDPEDGSWLSIDGSLLYKHTVAASERYNSRLEAELTRRLGVQWRTVRNARSEKRSVREIVGIADSLIAAWSSRRAHIEARLSELTDRFQAAHGRVPTTKESYALAQQANLETREAKGEHRSWEEQRAQWLGQASTVLGSLEQVHAMVSRAIRGTRTGRDDFAAEHGQELADLREKIGVQGAVHDDDIDAIATRVVEVVTRGHAVFQHAQLAAETERLARTLDISQAARAEGPDLVARVIAAAESAVDHEAPAVRLATAQSITVEASESPAGLRRRDGSSQYVTPHSRLYTTRQVLSAEQALVTAAGHRGGRVLTDQQLAIGLLSETANGVDLNRGQRQLVSQMATSSARVQLALAPAGTGKTTAMRALATSWTHSGGNIIALAPSAAAAGELGSSVGATGSTLARFVGVAIGRSKDRDGTFAALGPDSLVIIDEAGMASTRDLHAAVDYALGRGASVRLIGDDQQLAAVGAGGVLRDIATTHGALTLDEVVRFKTPGEAAASLALRSGDADEALGFYLDHSRVRAASPTTVTDEVYAAWANDRAAGREALMIAATRDQVNELNGRARAERLETAAERPDRSVVLESGLEASAGDTIVTRLNNYRLRIGARDFVKNGDRWNVEQVHRDGSLTVTHNDLGRQIRLPADYVAEHVDLGYATTVHGAQGQTVDSCFAIITGAETRQLAYVALTRGRLTNQAFVQVGGDGDPHNMLTPDAVLPKTAAEVLYVVFGRDGSAVSATTTSTEELSPQARLQYAAGVYANAVGRAAEVHVGVERLAAYAARAEELAPTITQSRSWPLLAQHLALLETRGADPLADLASAVKRRSLDDALDLAVVVLWRLSPTELRGGPLEWLPKIPASLEEGYITWLSDRAGEVTAAADDLREQARAWTIETAPAWAQPILANDATDARDAGRDDPRDLVADLAVWRCTKRIDDTDLRAAGPRPSSRAERPTWDRLMRRVADRTIDPENTAAGWWSKQIHVQHRITQDPWWPILASRLDELAIREDWINDDILDVLETRLAQQTREPVSTAGPDSIAPSEKTKPAGSTETAETTSTVEPAEPSPALQATESLSSADLRLVEAHEAAATFYRDHLEGSWASETLIERGMGHLIDPSPTGAGYAPRDPQALSSHLAGLGFSNDELIAAGLAMPAKDGNGIVDRFRDRLMLPIFRTIEGSARQVGFSGRKSREAPDYIPKYLNTAATTIYDKSNIVDGLATHAELLRNGARPVFVEGKLDAEAITLACNGAAVGLSTGGTSLTPGHLAALGEVVDLATTPVVAAYDNDAAGRKAAARAWKLLQEGGCTDSRAAALPAGADPAQLVEAGEADELAKVVLETTTPLITRRVSARIADWEPVLDHLDGKFGLIDAVARDLEQATPAEYGIAAAQLMLATDLDVDVFHARLDEAMSQAHPDGQAELHRSSTEDQAATASDFPTLPAGEKPRGREILTALIDGILEQALPDEHAAAALWARLRNQIEDMPPAAGEGPSTPERALLEHVDLDEAARVMGTPQWQEIDEALRAQLREDPDAYAREMSDQIARARRMDGRIDENSLVASLRPTLSPTTQPEPTSRRTPLPKVKRPATDPASRERARRAAQLADDLARERLRREQQRRHDDHHRGPTQGPGGPSL